MILKIARRSSALSGAWLLACSLGIAHAGPDTEVASALDRGDRFDLHLTLDYDLVFEQAEIKREWNRNFGDPDDPQNDMRVDVTDPLPVVNDLIARGRRQVLVPRLELGLFTDLSASVALPLVLSDSRSLDLDDRGRMAVDRASSTTIVDGLLPPTGFDAGDPATGFADGNILFRSPDRAGIDQIHLGLTWAPMNQARDDTKPTWKLGAEARLAIGEPMRLDPADPGSQTGVGRGVHEVRVWTSIAKRAGWAEPFFEVWWQAPVGTTGDSPFEAVGFGQNRPGHQQQAGTRFGFQAVAWQRPARGHRVSVELAARLDAHFEGRAYTPMWEVFQLAGDPANPDAVLVLDADPTVDGRQDLAHPGITNVENYLRFGGRVGVEAALGRSIRLGAAVELLAAQDHAITFADTGVDGDDPGDNVNPGTAEVNPTHAQIIDLVGSRYRVEESVDFHVLIETRILF